MEMQGKRLVQLIFRMDLRIQMEIELKGLILHCLEATIVLYTIAMWVYKWYHIRARELHQESIQKGSRDSTLQMV